MDLVFRIGYRQTPAQSASIWFVVQFSVTWQKLGRQKNPGGVAQLGEHLLCKQGVRGSIPLISTSRQVAARCVRKGNPERTAPKLRSVAQVDRARA